MPRAIWALAMEFEQCEFRLLGYLIMRQVRFGTAAIGLTLDELMRGVVRNGERVDRGAGLSRNALKRAMKLLELRGWITVVNTSHHAKFSQLTITVNLSQCDADDPIVTIQSSQRDDSLYKEESKKEKEKNEGITREDEKPLSPNTTPEPQEPPSQPPVAATVVAEEEVLPAWLAPHAERWAAFVAHRTQLGFPLTANARDALLKKLARLMSQGQDIPTVFDEAMIANYRGVFAVKEYDRARPGTARTTPPSKSDRAIEAHNEALARLLAARRAGSGGGGCESH